MRLWLSVYLPLFPLETHRPCWSEPGWYVVIKRERMLVASPLALDAGVRVGMKRNGVLTLCPNAVLHERGEQRECAVLDAVALCLLQYTPEVAFAEQHSLVMDIGASLAAFGGVPRLFRMVTADVLALAFTGRWGMAPTAQGAWLLAHADGNVNLVTESGAGPLSARARAVLRLAGRDWLPYLGRAATPAARRTQAPLQ